MIHYPLVSSLLLGLSLLLAAPPSAKAPAGPSNAAADPSSDEVIAEVMQEGMTSGLAKRVAKGEEPVEGRRELLELFQRLEGTSPSIGHQADWDKRVKALVAAAEDAVDDKEGYAKRLRKAVNCGACHKAHRE
ncbi:hypothetical protein KOR34_14640 [Posidoniimonas corsicana]|uniref:Cytochrome C n=1 Tax=Posidoniimonas corsicana TaxID=1938618 RepID=A0A5C5VD86_9BACT|nr:hypothetical protein [Posidoniimonas corsicana]TWT36558.1 hypothetical protein KOR34_14640 [Posidoniimonas corsicana]